MINETEGTLKYNAANYFMRTETNIVFYRGVHWWNDVVDFAATYVIRNDTN